MIDQIERSSGRDQRDSEEINPSLLDGQDYTERTHNNNSMPECLLSLHRNRKGLRKLVLLDKHVPPQRGQSNSAHLPGVRAAVSATQTNREESITVDIAWYVAQDMVVHSDKVRITQPRRQTETRPVRYDRSTGIPSSYMTTENWNVLDFPTNLRPPFCHRLVLRSVK